MEYFILLSPSQSLPTKTLFKIFNYKIDFPQMEKPFSEKNSLLHVEQQKKREEQRKILQKMTKINSAVN